MKHPDHIQNYTGSLDELAKELGDLRYDALGEFLQALANKIQLDGDADLDRGRKKLASKLHHTAKQLRSSAQAIKEAWIICKPFMNQ